MFRRVLVANRGEIARRIIRACTSLGVKSVAVYSEADADASYLREADETVCIGPAPATQSYLNQDAILAAAIATDCEAIHPGYGFLAENASFATRCEQQKLTFIGPRPSQIKQMGDKATARATMKAAGLPVMPGSSSILSSPEEASRVANEIGFPILLKATAGGGGKGMRLVSSIDELLSQYQQASAEALSAFGNADLYAEKFIVGARHIEFQILADVYGHVLVLGERECSIQRNHQKLVEESPAHGITDEVRRKMVAQIVQAITAVGYQGAGTLEFLCDSDGQFYFMEMNTRIQVEHPVTELVTGIDLVAWQIRIAAGEKLAFSQPDIHIKGHAIECRINAEDPSDNFRPSPGLISRFVVPSLVRLDSHVESGSVIAPYYDSMIGKLISYGENRDEAVARMKLALDEMVVDGVATTLPLHRQIIRNARFQKGAYTCAFIQEEKLWQK